MSTDLDVPELDPEVLDRQKRRRRSAREAVATWRAAVANDAGDLLVELMRHRAALVVQELEEGDLVRSRLSRLVGRAELKGAAYGPRDVAAGAAQVFRLAGAVA